MLEVCHIESMLLAYIWELKQLPDSALKRRKVFLQVSERRQLLTWNILQGLLCVSFSFLSSHHFFFFSDYGKTLLYSVKSHVIKSKLLVSSYIKITGTRANLLKANSPEVSRASPLTYILDFPRKPMVILPEQRDWHLIPRFWDLHLYPEWVHTVTQGNATVLVNNSAPAYFFTKMISNVHSSEVYLSHAEHVHIYPEIPWYKYEY